MVKMNELKNHINSIIKKVLMRMPYEYYSYEAHELVYRTGMAETGYRALKQYSGGPGIGFFQVEPDTLKDIMKNYVSYRPPLKACLMEFGLDEKDIEFSVLTNIALQVAFCRIHYRRNPHKIPESLEKQAEYWKEHYNTKLGKGTVGHFIEANEDE